MAKNKLEYYASAVQRQKDWIKQCGNDLNGYILRYGDPDVLCANGKPMFGDGGTLIYQADMQVLNRVEKELSSFKIRGHINV